MTQRLSGYADRISVRPGDEIRFMLSAEPAANVQTELVRLIHGDAHPGGPGHVEKLVEAAVNGTRAVSRQAVQNGNFLTVDDPDGRLAPAGAFTLYAFVQPALPQRGRQALLGRWAAGGGGFGLEIDETGHFAFRLSDGTASDAVVAPVPIAARTWYLVVVAFDPATRRASIAQHAIVGRYNGLLSKIVPIDYDGAAERRLDIAPTPHGQFVIGAAVTNDRLGHCYNGKIDRCGMLAGLPPEHFVELLLTGAAPDRNVVAHWDTSRGYTDRGIDDLVIDVGPHGLHAFGVNRPVRGQTGWNWRGRDDSFRLAPDQYGGIEFHEDALTDCRWQPSLTWRLPDDLRSGAYALKVSAPDAGGKSEYVVFFVRPRTPKARICFLVPTASYLAYANGPRSLEADVAQVIMGRVPVLQRHDMEACASDYDYGLSTYDLHRDGAGVCYSSYRRPMYTMQPDYRLPGVSSPWQFPADLSVIAWLEHEGYDYEILTDEDLDREGAAALRPYRVVINGTHCEYVSERMMDATEDYLAEGGRLLYLSGNGYYWVVGFRPEEPWVMEVRKLDAGSRAWQARPGEHYLASTGEPGGLWRHRNRAPQKIVGTGFAAEGMDISVPYRRLPESYDPRYAWIFDGVEGDVIGDFGLAHGGAVGLEIDRYDLTLGTPPHASILAMSEPLTANWPIVQEEVLYTYPGLGGDQHPEVRCDMVYFTTRQNGAVFSPSSIAWGSALPWNGFDNNVARIMRNVVDAFMQDGPLPAGASD